MLVNGSLLDAGVIGRLRALLLTVELVGTQPLKAGVAVDFDLLLAAA